MAHPRRHADFPSPSVSTDKDGPSCHSLTAGGRVTRPRCTIIVCLTMWLEVMFCVMRLHFTLTHTHTHVCVCVFRIGSNTCKSSKIKSIQVCMILGFLRSVNDVCALMGSYVAEIVVIYLRFGTIYCSSLQGGKNYQPSLLDPWSLDRIVGSKLRWINTSLLRLTRKKSEDMVVACVKG